MRADLKNTTDDVLPVFLSSLRFRQSHLVSDVRLALGYSAVALSAATFLLDRQYGWDKTKDYTLWAVVVYFVLNTALNGWMTFVEKGQVFVGTRDNITVWWRAFFTTAVAADGSDLHRDAVREVLPRIQGQSHVPRLRATGIVGVIERHRGGALLEVVHPRRPPHCGASAEVAGG